MPSLTERFPQGLTLPTFRSYQELALQCLFLVIFFFGQILTALCLGERVAAGGSHGDAASPVVHVLLAVAGGSQLLRRPPRPQDAPVLRVRHGPGGVPRDALLFSRLCLSQQGRGRYILLKIWKNRCFELKIVQIVLLFYYKNLLQNTQPRPGLFHSAHPPQTEVLLFREFRHAGDAAARGRLE